MFIGFEKMDITETGCKWPGLNVRLRGGEYWYFPEEREREKGEGGSGEKAVGGGRGESSILWLQGVGSG